jgi:hypothetical protein
MPILGEKERPGKTGRLFFDVSKMKPPSLMYVCWIDVMGSGSSMRRSISLAANFVMKLHMVALEVGSKYRTVALYPVIDGLYACATEQKAVLGFLNEVFLKLAQNFIEEKELMFKFCIRAGLAFGPVVTGDDVKLGSDILNKNEQYCRHILLGITLSQAYDSARDAAPFGISLHESARAFAPPNTSVLSGTCYNWWKLVGTGKPPQPLKDALNGYHKWCLTHTATLLYEKTRIDAHSALVDDYFTD